MAEVDDVEDTLIGIIAGVLFPNGVDQPSIVGPCAQIMAGWPLPAQLDAAMKAGKALISIFPSTSRNTTRTLPRWQQLSIKTPTLALAKVSGSVSDGWTAGDGTTSAGDDTPIGGGPDVTPDEWDVGSGSILAGGEMPAGSGGSAGDDWNAGDGDVTAGSDTPVGGGSSAIVAGVQVSGTIPPAQNPHNAVIFVNGMPFVYAVQPTDSLNGIATALSALIAPQVPGTSSSGPVVTFPVSARVGATRIGVTGTSYMEICRQEQQFWIIVWAPTPLLRRQFAQPIDLDLKRRTFIALPDLTQGRIRSVGMREYDQYQKQGIYRRDLVFSVEYATIDTRVDTQVTQIVTNVSVAPSAADAATVYV